LSKHLNNKIADITGKDSQVMNLVNIIKLADGLLLTQDMDTDIEINGGYGADLMSDVLAFSQPDSVLITGLTNPQVVRTAQMAEFRAIIFVRGKQPQAETLQIAMQEGIPLITSPFGMFELSGRLHRAGLPSFESNEPN
jgi:predicted transcriptional regulator